MQLRGRWCVITALNWLANRPPLHGLIYQNHTTNQLRALRLTDSGECNMSTITVKDGTTIYYKDWGNGPVVTFSHGWPLNSDAWDGQMLFLAQNGFRVVAHDRRGHGRSSQAWSGNDMNGYADDLAA